MWTSEIWFVEVLLYIWTNQHASVLWDVPRINAPLFSKMSRKYKHRAELKKSLLEWTNPSLHPAWRRPGKLVSGYRGDQLTPPRMKIDYSWLNSHISKCNSLNSGQWAFPERSLEPWPRASPGLLQHRGAPWSWQAGSGLSGISQNDSGCCAFFFNPKRSSPESMTLPFKPPVLSWSWLHSPLVQSYVRGNLVVIPQYMGTEVKFRSQQKLGISPSSAPCESNKSFICVFRYCQLIFSNLSCIKLLKYGLFSNRLGCKCAKCATHNSVP